MISAIGLRTVLALVDSRGNRLLQKSLAESGMDIVGAARTGEAALNAVRAEIPDIVVMDLILPVSDALNTLRLMRNEPMMVMPAVLVLAPQGAGRLERLVREEGVCHVLRKPVSFGEMVAAVESLTEDSRLPRSGDVSARLRKCLSGLGFRSSHTGTEYLATAAEYASRDMRMVASLATRVYPLVAKRHFVAVESVESCIRRAIEWAWLNGSIDEQHRLFDGITDEKRGKPTNGEMIAHLAELLRLKEI